MYRRAVPTLLLCLILAIPGISQTDGRSIQEEQDYAFAVGLYRDRMYRMAHEEFQKFVRTYPNSAKAMNARFLSIESLFFWSNIVKPNGGIRNS
jgi:TolA-binding protein